MSACLIPLRCPTRTAVLRLEVRNGGDLMVQQRVVVR